MDREKVIKGLEAIREFFGFGLPSQSPTFEAYQNILTDALALLKEQDSLLGIQQTADGITFISTGTAHQGEARGILLGKLLMHEWIYKELLCKGLLTDDIQSVFEQAKHI